MKVTLSIPDQLAKEADQLAKKLGVTRSAIYTQALRQRFRELADRKTTNQINVALD